MFRVGCTGWQMGHTDTCCGLFNGNEVDFVEDEPYTINDPCVIGEMSVVGNEAGKASALCS